MKLYIVSSNYPAMKRNTVRIQSITAPLLPLPSKSKMLHSFCNGIFLVLRVPADSQIAFGSIEQGEMCLDTMGQNSGASVGLYICHHSGGNQVRSTMQHAHKVPQNGYA